MDYLPEVRSVIDTVKRAQNIRKERQFKYFFQLASDRISVAAEDGRGKCQLEVPVKTFDLILSEEGLPEVFEQFICNGYEVSLTNSYTEDREPSMVFTIKWL